MAARPGIVLFLADDTGIEDLACYGAAGIKTPHIDGSARDGVRYTQFYANAPECTPSRTALLTGRYPHRAGGLECAIGVRNVGRYDEAEWLQKRGELGLPAEETSLAKMLGVGGYQTACIGKWHLGYELLSGIAGDKEEAHEAHFGVERGGGIIGIAVVVVGVKALADIVGIGGEVFVADVKTVVDDGHVDALACIAHVEIEGGALEVPLAGIEGVGRESLEYLAFVLDDGEYGGELEAALQSEPVGGFEGREGVGV